jgi:hypothetical protein
LLGKLLADGQLDLLDEQVFVHSKQVQRTHLVVQLDLMDEGLRAVRRARGGSERPRDLAMAVECSATQGRAKQCSYIFVYSYRSLNTPLLPAVARTMTKTIRAVAAHFGVVKRF